MIAILLGCEATQNKMLITIQNPSSFNRNNEIVEIDWNELQQNISLKQGESIIVTDDNGNQIPYQLLLNDDNTTKSLIFLASVEMQKNAVYNISKGQPESFKSLVYGRLVPERKDDFTWENNRTAFRVYGPALKAAGEISNGMDFWSKKTEELIIDKWYENDLSNVASYHTDHGEGLDFYKVGRTLGLGMTAPIDYDTLCLGDNFVTSEIIDNGPLRISFKLTYEPYLSGSHKIKETRVISLDAYSLFNKVTNVFETDTTMLTIATGIVMPDDNPQEVVLNSTFGDNSGIIAYKTPTDEVNGTNYAAVINPKGFGVIKVSNGHYLGLNSYIPGDEYTYYSGGGWNEAGFDSFDNWKEYVKIQKEIIDNPLIIQIN